MTDNHGERLASLEAKMDGMSETLKEVSSSLRALVRLEHRSETNSDAIRALDSEIEGIAERLTRVESAQATQSGKWAAVTILAVVVATLGSWFVPMLLDKAFG